VGALGLRLTGALVAGSLAATAAVISAWLNLYWWSVGSGGLAIAGVGVGLVLGFIAAPQAARTSHPVWEALGLTVSAAAVGWTVVGMASIASMGGRGIGFPTMSVGAFLLSSLIALPVAILFAFPFTAVVAFLGVAILRKVARSRLLAAMAVAASMSLVALASALAGALPAPELSIDVATSPVQLEWTVVNHSRRPLELGIFDHDTNGYGGSIAGIEPCFTTTGQNGVDSDWFLTLDPESEQRTPPELVSAEEAHGSDVSVWVEIASDGSTSVEIGRASPSAEELTVDHCLAGGAR
jgi:hypothetical protein